MEDYKELYRNKIDEVINSILKETENLLVLLTLLDEEEYYISHLRNFLLTHNHSINKKVLVKLKEKYNDKT